MAHRKSRPLKPARFYILLALADHNRHGSDIMREVLHLSDGHLKLWPTMLYSTLESLQEASWIEECTDPDSRPSGQSMRRRYYRITDAGREAMERETERLSMLIELARLRGRGRGEETV